MSDENEETGPLFYYGGQVNPDGDMLPATFTIFPTVVCQHEACEVIAGKIAAQLDELGIEESEGMMAFAPVFDWETFAEIDMPDTVKMDALTESVMSLFLGTLTNSPEKVTELVTTVWGMNK